MNEATRKEIQLYIEHARESLAVARLNLDNDFYSAAVNRAYYAIFYAANALLSTQGLARNKHSGVLAAFRQHFVKTGVVRPEMSEIYGRVMDDRHISDYELIGNLSHEKAARDLEQASTFVDLVESVLKEKRWI